MEGQREWYYLENTAGTHGKTIIWNYVVPQFSVPPRWLFPVEKSHFHQVDREGWDQEVKALEMEAPASLELLQANQAGKHAMRMDQGGMPNDSYS